MELFLLWVAVVLTQVGDYWSTKRALRSSGVREGNPVVRRLGLVPLKITGSLFYSLVVWMVWRESQTLAIGFTGVLVAFYAWVVWHNYHIVRR